MLLPLPLLMAILLLNIRHHAIFTELATPGFLPDAMMPRHAAIRRAMSFFAAYMATSFSAMTRYAAMRAADFLLHIAAFSRHYLPYAAAAMPVMPYAEDAAAFIDAALLR